MTNSNKPVILMPEDIQRLIGKDAQRNNIAAAKMVAEVARTQESEIGDGTTSAVMIAGKLLENAEKLLDMKIHPTVIIKGYQIAAKKAQEILKEISFKVDNSQDNHELLKQIAMTAMTGKCAEDAKEKLAEIIVEAVKQIKIDQTNDFNIDNIKIIKIKGESIKDSELIFGIVLEKDKISHEMPSEIKGARIALIDVPLELKNPEIDTKISISSPEQLQGFL